MNFFVKFHRSMVDPSLYVEAAASTWANSLGYLLRLFALTLAITCAAHFYYVIDKETGLPAELSALFGGMEIRNGALDPGRQTPYLPEKPHMANAADVLFDATGSMQILPDSLLVVDTGKAAAIPDNSSIGVLMRADHAEMRVGAGGIIKVSYAELLAPRASFDFSVKAFRDYLVRHAGSLAFLLLLKDAFAGAVVTVFSILFLGFAAHIFSLSKPLAVREQFKMVCFAVTPLCTGNALVAISGARLFWPWYLFIFISATVLLRGIRAVLTSRSGEQPPVPRS